MNFEYSFDFFYDSNNDNTFVYNNLNELAVNLAESKHNNSKYNSFL